MQAQTAKASWIEEVKRVIERANKRYAEAQQSFAEQASRSGLTSAIEWQGAGVAAAEAVAQELSWFSDGLTNRPMSAEDLASALVKEIETRQISMLNCFRVAASTSAFSNAVENAKLEAKMKMFNTFGGEYHVILTIVGHRDQQ